MAANIAVAQHPAGNLKPAKDKSTERIDSIVALIMAIRRAIVAKEKVRCTPGPCGSERHTASDGCFPAAAYFACQVWQNGSRSSSSRPIPRPVASSRPGPAAGARP